VYDKGNRIMRKILLALFVIFIAKTALADEVTLKEGHPESYTVVKGDTLWGISDRFLNDSWLWPNIWYINQEIANPHLIFPGDVIGLMRVGSQTKITVLQRGEVSRTVKLTPSARIEPISSAIPAIPLDAVAPFITGSRIVEKQDLYDAPHAIAGQEGRLISGSGSNMYFRGKFKKEDVAPAYGIYRKGKTYVDPDSGELLGYEAKEIGNGRTVDVNGDIITIGLTNTSQEVRSGDRLLSTEDRKVSSSFHPKAPDDEMTGRIVSVFGGVSQIGQFDIIVINRGERDGIKEGHVLAIYKELGIVVDRVTNEKVKLPTERGGLMMVFRTFEKLSYALVMKATLTLSVGDELRNP
jgi:hypothetical protein